MPFTIGHWKKYTKLKAKMKKQAELEKKDPQAERLRNAAIRITMMPRDTNAHGTIFGGIILSYIDIAGGVEAVRNTGHDRFVTVAMKKLSFTSRFSSATW
jgi:acyl-CoA hydrolase